MERIKGLGMNNEQLKSATNNRRQFIKKASAGVVITSLPMKSVWGTQCTASGAMSGNLSGGGQAAAPCAVPTLEGGRSPGFWYEGKPMKLAEYNHKSKKMKDNKAVGGAFTYLKNVCGNTWENRDCYRKFVHSVYSFDMNLDSNLCQAATGGVHSSFSVKKGFDSKATYNNMFRDLAAVYMNVYFGFYVGAGYQDSQDATAVCNSLLASYVSTGVWFTDSELGWPEGDTEGETGGTSGFALNSCSIS